MEILNINFPFPKQIITLFFESFKNHVPYDIIRIIWNIYKDSNGYYIIYYKYYQMRLCFYDSEYYLKKSYSFNTGQIKIISLYWNQEIGYHNLKLSNNKNMKNYFKHIDDYLTSTIFTNIILNDSYPLKYIPNGYKNNGYIFKMSYSKTKKLNKIMKNNSFIKIIFRLYSVHSFYNSVNKLVYYYPKFKIIKIEK